MFKVVIVRASTIFIAIVLILIQSSAVVLLFNGIIIYLEDYLNGIIEIIYVLLITLYSFNLVIFSSFLSFLFLNIGSISIFISIKCFIWISLLVGNIIDIYIFGLIAVLIYWLHYYWLFGILLSSFLLYLFLTKIEFFLLVLFYLESSSSLFQSLTLANRLSINLIAGSLLMSLLSISIRILLYTIDYIE